MLAFRIASLDDAEGIFSAMEGVATEIPVRLDSAAARDAILSRIVRCCGVAGSRIAIDSSGRVVGFLLVEPNGWFRFSKGDQVPKGGEALHLPYGGVTKCSRGQGVFASLIAQVMQQQVPVTATVKHANTSGMSDRLIKIGFSMLGSAGDEDEFCWQPRS